MANFDTISKYLVQTYPGDFARFTLGREDVEVLELLDNEQPTPQTPRTDSTLRVRIGGEEVLVHTEFQTTDSTHVPMPRRMAGYIGRAIERHGLPVFSSVLYLRPNAGRKDPGHHLQERPGHRILVEYKVIRLIELDGQHILEEGHPGLIPFAPLMRPPAGLEAAGWLSQCIHAAHALPIDRAAQADLLSGLSILSGLVYGSETITDLISREGIMDILRESSFAQYLTQQAREEGKEEGIEQGLRESIRDVLEIRFGLGAADTLAPLVAAISDVQHLKQLHRAAIQVASLEEFRALVKAAE